MSLRASGISRSGPVPTTLFTRSIERAIQGSQPLQNSKVIAVDPVDLEAFRESLVAKQREVMDLYEHDIRVGKESTDDNSDDFADRANNSYNRETMFALGNTEREMLIRIDEAFQRLDKGSYGACDYCSNSIGLERLKAVPWARYCIGCQELEEKGLLD
jgi:DnaK suppressor protein